VLRCVVRADENAAVAAALLSPSFSLAAANHASDVLDMPVDPNEPTYCLCHQVSYGEMIGCDNHDVSHSRLCLKTTSLPVCVSAYAACCANFIKTTD